MNFFEKLLNYFDVDKNEYNHLSRPIEDIVLPDYNSLLGVEKAVKRIKLAIDNNEKIVVYGDYDTDGIMATSIMVKAFKMLNYDVGYYIPSRYLDGYGLNKTKIDEFKAKNYKLIITVDNGISLIDEVDYANSLGIDVIVTDHHEIQDKLPNAVSIIHPITSKLGDIIASGGVMAFFLASSLLNKVDNYLLSLASISIISDLMELKGYNRDIVRLGLNLLNKYNYYQFNLLNESGFYTEKSIGLKIAPKINAVGRMKEDTSINRLVRYFTSENREEIKFYFDDIAEINESRKALTTETLNTIKFDVDNYGICEVLNIKEGLIGLVANKLMNDYQKPTIIFTHDFKNKEILKCSARSKKGCDISKFIESIKDKLLSGGGHELAAGFSINSYDFIEIKEKFNQYAKENPFIDEEKDTLEISLNDVTRENYDILETFSPFGAGFPEPLFKIRNIKTMSLSYMNMGKHIGTPIGMNTRIIGFNMPREEISQHTFIDIYGCLNKSEFRGKFNIDFTISDYKEID